MTDMPATDDDRLCAYLDGELPEHEARAVEQQCADDPALAARLAALHDALVVLRDLDRVDPPAGYPQRLHARIARELSAASTSDAEVRARGRPPTGWAIGIAAAVLLAAVVSGAALRGLAVGGGAGEEAAEGGPAQEADTPAELQRQDEPAGVLDGGEGPAPDRRARVQAEPVILADEAAVRARYAGHPAVAAVLGATPGAGADSALPDGRLPTAGPSPGRDCLAAPGVSVGPPGVPVVAEPVTYRGAPRVAVVVVTAGADAVVLDRVEVRLLDPQTCAAVEVIPIPGPGE
jgi:hypothetical protein